MKKIKEKIKELLWLLYYSLLKEPLNELWNILLEFKKPRLWMWMAVIVSAFGVYYKKYDVIKTSLVVIIIIYFIRHKVDGAYKRDMFESSLKKNKDSAIVMDYYNNYKSKCYYAKKEPMDYEQWKASEINKIDKENPGG